MKVKARVNLHGIMNLTNALMVEAKDVPDTMDTSEEQAPAQPEQEKANENNEQPPQSDASNGQPEVGSSGWTKKISAWFSRVRY